MITMKYINESLGESLHTALRKLCDTQSTSILYSNINDHPNDWMIYLDIIKEMLPNITSDIVGQELYDAATKFCRMNARSEAKPFKVALTAMTLDEFGSMGGYLISDLKGLEKEQPTLVGCDTIDKAIAFACTYDTLEEALEWICIWEHESSLKRESTDTCFGLATKKVVSYYKEREPKFIAFWKHDLYPFMLSSEVVEFLANGNVKTKNFKGMVMAPTHIMEKTIGDKYAAALRELTQERTIAQQILNKTFNDKLETINKEYVK